MLFMSLPEANAYIGFSRRGNLAGCKNIVRAQEKSLKHSLRIKIIVKIPPIFYLQSLRERKTKRSNVIFCQ